MLLNIDLGELPGEPEELYAHAHVASIACGGHAGDAASMRRALELCLAHGARAGAHPSYPDRSGFGRARMAMATDALTATLDDQCAHLADLARRATTTIEFVKAHGALYHAATTERAIAGALVQAAVRAFGGAITVIGPPRGALREVAASMGVRYLREGFADRATRPDGSLVPRSQPGALVTEPAEAAALAQRLARAGDLDTLCVHGDTPGAVALARAVRASLDALASGAA